MGEEQVAEFRAQLRMLQRRLRRELHPGQGLSRTVLQVLGAIDRLGHGPTPTQVAEDLQMTSSNVAASLRELEAGGLIRRQRDPADARRVLLFLTDLGSGLVAEFHKERNSWFGQAVEATLSEKDQQTLFAAGRLLQRVAEYEQPRPPGAGS
jgi:DNA-binding MarR family transcriptional regulator